MIYSGITFLKKELYKKTQYNITRSKFKDSETVCFSEADIANVEWKEKKEFILNGYSYDIIQIRIINGEKKIFCYRDKKDMIINSLVDLSKKLAVQNIDLHKHIDFPLHHKSGCKTSLFFAVISHKEDEVSDNSDFRILPDYNFPSANTSYISIIPPPPEMCSPSKQI
ncbi:hypothetical protein [Chryseobacterium indologenes]|uniref:Uncharacterized protein n=1 Tax=Chryseobacterium indologenes TaxID=253 RepID=A0A411DIB5_CHRID|nr:hypothetical protein EU348_02375 [Chryseobacterium indologenes]